MEKIDSYRPTLTALQRSLIALVFGGLIWFVTAGRYSWQTRLLLAWLAYALIVLSLIWVIIGWADTRANRTAGGREPNGHLSVNRGWGHV